VVDDLAEPPNELEAGLERSRGGFMSRLRGLLGGSQISPEAWDEVEEALIAGDVGASLAAEIVERARARRDAPSAEVAVRAELAAVLSDAAMQPPAGTPPRPRIVLVVGVNGTGKTTTIGKLAHLEQKAGHRVILAAADTFRAAAIGQLRIWPTRPGPILPPSSTTRSTRPSPAARTRSSSTRPAGSTRKPTSWMSSRRSGGSWIAGSRMPSPRPSSSWTRRQARTVSRRPSRFMRRWA